MKRVLGGRVVVAMLAGITLWAGGVTIAQAAQLYTFEPPADWQDLTHTNFPDRAVAVWRGPTDSHFGENILVIAKPTHQTLDEASDVKTVAGSMAGAQGTRRAMEICGGHPAMYVYITAPFIGHTLISETVVSVWDKMGYSATYSRLDYQPTVQAARSALTTLCPPSSNSSTSW